MKESACVLFGDRRRSRTYRVKILNKARVFIEDFLLEGRKTLWRRGSLRQ